MEFAIFALLFKNKLIQGNKMKKTNGRDRSRDVHDKREVIGANCFMMCIVGSVSIFGLVLTASLSLTWFLSVLMFVPAYCYLLVSYAQSPKLVVFNLISKKVLELRVVVGDNTNMVIAALAMLATSILNFIYISNKTGSIFFAMFLFSVHLIVSKISLGLMEKHVRN